MRRSMTNDAEACSDKQDEPDSLSCSSCLSNSSVSFVIPRRVSRGVLTIMLEIFFMGRDGGGVGGDDSEDWAQHTPERQWVHVWSDMLWWPQQ